MLAGAEAERELDRLFRREVQSEERQRGRQQRSRERVRQGSEGSLFADESRGQNGRDCGGAERREVPTGAREQRRGDRAERPTGGPGDPEQGESAAGEPGDDAESAQIRGEHHGLSVAGAQHVREEEQREPEEPEEVLEGRAVDRRGEQTVDAEQVQNGGRPGLWHTDGRGVRRPGVAGEAAGSVALQGAK